MFDALLRYAAFDNGMCIVAQISMGCLLTFTQLFTITTILDVD